MQPPDEGDLCGINGCTGTFQIQPPMDWDWREAGCSCHISPPCGWCVDHELRCTDCSIRPEEIEIAIGPLVEMTTEFENRLSNLISRCPAPLVSLDSEPEICHSGCNMLRIDPVLHFPIGKVFEVPDEFNGAQRGTFYFRTESSLRGPFMNEAEADFAMRRRIPTT